MCNQSRTYLTEIFVVLEQVGLSVNLLYKMNKRKFKPVGGLTYELVISEVCKREQ